METWFGPEPSLPDWPEGHATKVKLDLRRGLIHGSSYLGLFILILSNVNGSSLQRPASVTV